MGNRKLPFGYQMRFGDVIPHPDEAEAVQKIYQNYLAGASFRQIAEGLQAQGIPYDGAKPWNKNMVARILENERYTGIGPFPALVPAELFRAVQDRRIQTAPERTQTPAQKELQTMLDAVGEIVDLTSRAFLQDDLALARQVEPLEQVIDKLKDELRTNHIARLQRGECSLAAGFVLSDLLTNLERVSDHCSNIAGCLLDMKNERIDLHKYLGDVKSGSNEFLLQYNAFEEKYKLEA